MDDKTSKYNNEMMNTQTTSNLSYLLNKYCELINSIDEIKSEYNKSLDNQYYTLMSEIYFTRETLLLIIGAIMFSSASGFVGIGLSAIGILLGIIYFVASYQCRKKVE